MAYRLTCKITIGKYLFSYASEVTIDTGWDNFGDKASIKLPNLVRFEGVKTRSEDLVKTGDKVEIKLGYDNNNVTEFVGYVSDIMPKTPFEIKCEDEIYQLKRAGNITASYTSVTLANLIKELVPEVVLDSKTPEIILENFRIRQATKAEVLQELKEKYLLAVFYRAGKLYVGLPYFDKITSTAIAYHFQKNIASESLAYRKKEDVKIKAKAYSINRSGSRIEVEVGDKDGEIRTLPYQNILTREALEQQATLDLAGLKFEGYQGDFTAFGLPYCAHSDSVQFYDDRYPNREGRYLIDKIRVSWGSRGFRRIISLGKKYD